MKTLLKPFILVILLFTLNSNCNAQFKISNFTGDNKNYAYSVKIAPINKTDYTLIINDEKSTNKFNSGIVLNSTDKKEFYTAIHLLKNEFENWVTSADSSSVKELEKKLVVPFKLVGYAVNKSDLWNVDYLSQKTQVSFKRSTGTDNKTKNFFIIEPDPTNLSNSKNLALTELETLKITLGSVDEVEYFLRSISDGLIANFISK